MINFLLWRYEQDLHFVNSTHHNVYSNLLFKAIHWCRRTVCSKFPHAAQSYTKCWGNFGQQYFSFWFILNFMPYNLNMKNIIIHNKTRDMLPSISSTIIYVRCSEHANSKSVQSSPISRYVRLFCCIFSICTSPFHGINNLIAVLFSTVGVVLCVSYEIWSRFWMRRSSRRSPCCWAMFWIVGPLPISST